MLKQKIADDLKQAMLSGDKPRVELLGMLKSAILNKEIEAGMREEGLSDDDIITVLSKEAKKRQEAAEMYKNGGDPARSEKELSEKDIIDSYLPEQMSEEEVAAIVDGVIAEIQPEGMKDMGRVIGAVKAKAGNAADGSVVAQIVKDKLQ